jgi:type III HopA1-like effector protein
MRRSASELREIVDAVQIRSARSFSVVGEIIEIASKENDGDAVGSLLATVLYQRMYCRPESGRAVQSANTRAMRVFVDDLSEANHGRGAWEPGWVVKAIEQGGTLVVHRAQDDLTLWASAEQYRSGDRNIAVGSIGRLRIGKELREMLPGYYVILGDADQGDDIGSSAAVARFYWHLTASAAPAWIDELTRRFNAADIAFHAKVLSDPAAYLRADAGVLYVARQDLARAMDLLPALHRSVSSLLRHTTPMFTKRLARGLAAADDPGDGGSFGQHRCRLIAEGLMRAFAEGSTASGDVAAAIAARFEEGGLNIDRPWLNPGSRSIYAWPKGPQFATASRP